MPSSSSSFPQESCPKIAKLSHDVSNDIIPPLKIKKLSENAVLPSRASPLSAGYDLSSAVETKVPARGKALVPTDLSISIPQGAYARIAPRSGLAWKHSIDVGAGVVDADYRGPVGVVLFNYSDVDFEIKVGDRIAQMIIERIMTPDVVEVEDLDATVRGKGKKKIKRPLHAAELQDNITRLVSCLEQRTKKYCSSSPRVTQPSSYFNPALNQVLLQIQEFPLFKDDEDLYTEAVEVMENEKNIGIFDAIPGNGRKQIWLKKKIQQLRGTNNNMNNLDFI